MELESSEELIQNENSVTNLSTAHPISPAIERRIENLLRSTREDQDLEANIRPSNFSMCLRSRNRIRSAFTQ